MAAKVNRVLFGALAVSLAFHLLLFGSFDEVWFQPVRELEFPIEASLMGPPPARGVPAKPSLRPDRPALPAPVPETVSQPEVVPVPERTPPAPAVPAPAPEPTVAAEPESVAPVPAVTPPPAAARHVRSTVRTLPEALTLRYAVQNGGGDNGFVAGRATYVWQSRNGRYSLVSTLEATGLTSLFMSGRIVQASEGRVDEAGLHPEQYSLQRNERRQDQARFDWESGRIEMVGRGAAGLTAGAQDLLSFPFHLAMTASEGEWDFPLGVTNGRKFNEYLFQVLGRETVELRGRTYEVLHLRGSHARDGELDVWLDLGRTGLPMRVRTVDRKGTVMELRLEGAERGEAGSGG